MARVSDNGLDGYLRNADETGPQQMSEFIALDLREARALLAWIEKECRREYHSPDDLQRTILAELKGNDGQPVE